jgi:hypothetical protein
VGRCEAADANRVLARCEAPATRRVRCSEMRLALVLSAAGRASVKRSGCTELCARHAADTTGEAVAS